MTATAETAGLGALPQWDLAGSSIPGATAPN